MGPIDTIRFEGQDAVRLRAPSGAEATVLLHGGHLVSWKTPDGDEKLYLSPQARYDAGASIRGGVPVIFPQFNERGPLPRHGLVRTRRWTPTLNTVRGHVAIASLRLRDDMATRAHWPQGFEIELTVCIGGSELDIELVVTNTGDTPFRFTGALHTYLRLDDVREAQLLGLQGSLYEDALKNGTWGGPAGSLTTVVGAIDRVYVGVQNDLVLSEPGRSLRVQMSEFEEVVVWNPGPEAAAQLNDLPNDDWSRFLCVEAARIRQPVELAPGEDWAGRQRFLA
jgi:glucose-6-phosphate 1-epimerase